MKSHHIDKLLILEVWNFLLRSTYGIAICSCILRYGGLWIPNDLGFHAYVNEYSILYVYML